ncbi:MAG: NAD(P)H-dependent oxidoreductase [Aureispira sp.]|nr:NAD(P)H-dependent oxidoreductase [Aureispira sp.]
MRNLIAFGASSSRQSINKTLANFAANQVEDVDVTLLDLNDFKMPAYTIELEEESGIPSVAYDFKEKIKNSDGIVISFPEHKESYSPIFKNIFDWVSKIDQNIWTNKPMFLLATSMNNIAGRSILNTATNDFKLINTNTIISFFLPSYYQKFSEEDQKITETKLSKEFKVQLDLFIEAL